MDEEVRNSEYPRGSSGDHLSDDMTALSAGSFKKDAWLWAHQEEHEIAKTITPAISSAWKDLFVTPYSPSHYITFQIRCHLLREVFWAPHTSAFPSAQVGWAETPPGRGEPNIRHRVSTELMKGRTRTCIEE